MAQPVRKPEDIRVLVLHHQSSNYRDIIASRFPTLWPEICASYEELPAALARVAPEAVLSFKIGKGPFPREVLLGAPPLRWLHVGGAGIDHLGRWDPAKTTVTNSSGVHVAVLGQYVQCAMLTFGLNFNTYLAQQQRKEWKGGTLGDLRGKTLVVVGFGKIGQDAARRAKAMGMRVIGLRTRPEPSPYADAVMAIDRLAEVVREADYVALTLPLTDRTRGLVDAGIIAAIKPGAVLINIARGGIVDEAALVKALEAGHLRGAFFDVFATEPLPAESPLWTAPNLLMTPHVGDPEDWQQQIARLFCDNLERWLKGEPLKNVVSPDRGY